MIVNDRVYIGDDDQWYYRARGNTGVGPFANRQAAEEALNKQIRSWAGRTDPRAVWPSEFKPARFFRRSAPRHS